jgi:hypothetical protein
MPGLMLPVALRPIEPEFIAMLEDLVARAKSGELVAMGYVTQSRDGAVGTGWAGTGDHIRMVGGIAVLEHRYHFQALTN